ALLDWRSRVVLESTRHHNGQSGQWPSDGRRELDHVHASFDQPVHQPQVLVLVEPGVHALADLRSDTFDLDDLLQTRLAQSIHRAELARQQLSRLISDV